MRDAREIRDPPLELRKRVRFRFLVRIAKRGKRNFGRQNIVRVETGIDVLQPNETFEEQSRSGQQDERERHFGDDERVTQPIVMAAGGGTASALFERLG